MMKQLSILPTLQKKDTTIDKMIDLSSNMLKSIGSNLIGNPAEKDKPSKQHWIFQATLSVNNRYINTINPYIVVQPVDKEPTELNQSILTQLNPWVRTTAKVTWTCIGTIDIVNNPPHPLNTNQGYHYVRAK
jgi:hypothetical protein